jgi:ankyrin repeat protein
MKLFTFLLVGIIGIVGIIGFSTPGSAQSCDALCDPDFWQTQSNAVINKTIERSDVNARNEYVLTPLHVAAGSETPESLQLLIDAGAVQR